MINVLFLKAYSWYRTVHLIQFKILPKPAAGQVNKAIQGGGLGGTGETDFLHIIQINHDSFISRKNLKNTEKY